MTNYKAIQELNEMIEMYKSLRENGEKLRRCLVRNRQLQHNLVLNINELTETMNEYLSDVQHVADIVGRDDND